MTTTVPQFGTSERTSSRTGAYSVREVAAHLRITERAVLKRIAAGKLAARREGREWRINLSIPPGTEPASEPRSGSHSEPIPEMPIMAGVSGTTSGTDTGSEPFVVPTLDAERRAQADAVVQRILAPFVMELARTSEELGMVRADLRHEIERRERAERERDDAHLERDALYSRLMAVPADSAAQTLPDDAMRTHSDQREQDDPRSFYETQRAGETSSSSWWSRVLAFLAGE